MPDEAGSAAPAAPSAPAPSSPPAAPPGSGGQGPHQPPSGEVAPSAQDSIIGDSTRPPTEGGFKYVDHDGNFAKDWAAHLPDDFGDFRTKLGNYRNPVELAKALHSANQTISKKGVIVPTQTSSAEEVSAYRKQMGVPENPKGYLDKVPEMPEGVTFDESAANVYMEVAHKYHISKEAMAELMAVNAKQAEIQVKADRQRTSELRHTGQNQLRKVWGRDYDRNMGLTSRAVHFVGGNPNSYGFRDPEVVRIVASLAKELDEDRIIGPTGALPEGIHEMKASALDIMRNPANKDHQKYRDGDPDVRNRVRRMLEQAEKR